MQNVVHIVYDARLEQLSKNEKYGILDLDIELEGGEKINLEMQLNQWLAFIDRERGDLLEMAKKENELIKEADEEYNVLTGDAEIKRLEWIRMVSDMEEHSALQTAKNEGIEERKKRTV